MAGIKAPNSKSWLASRFSSRTPTSRYTLPELPAEHARWLDVADTALHNPEPREPRVNPESRAREQNQNSGEFETCRNQQPEPAAFLPLVRFRYEPPKRLLSMLQDFPKRIRECQELLPRPPKQLIQKEKRLNLCEFSLKTCIRCSGREGPNGGYSTANP